MNNNYNSTQLLNDTLEFTICWGIEKRNSIVKLSFQSNLKLHYNPINTSINILNLTYKKTINSISYYK